MHLIISDVNMPNMDGITFVKEVKNCRIKVNPVIMRPPRLGSEKAAGQAAGARPGWSSRSGRKQMITAVAVILQRAA